MEFPGIENASVREISTEEVEQQEYREITLILPGEPIAKQSVRFSVNRRFQQAEGMCPFCNRPTVFKKGDTLVFKNKVTGLADVIVNTYQDSKHDKRKEFYRMAIRPQLPKGFTMFTEEVHIVSVDFVFECLSSFPKWKKDAIRLGEVVYKISKPDVDNLTKPILDTLTGVIWQDDALIVSENGIRKIYGINPCIKITIRGK